MTDSDEFLLVLWDVDHTLIENGGVSKRTYARAFELLAGRPPDAQPVTDGRTDYRIMGDLCEANGLRSDAFERGTVESALVAAGQELLPELLRKGHPLDGAREALTYLGGAKSVLQSLLTGNIRPNAENKIRLLADAIDMLDLDVGGYGDDHIVRARLVGAAQRKASSRYGRVFDRHSTVLVGDTPLDVEAGLDGGVFVVGVATGTSTEEDLRAAGAHWTAPDLVDLAGFVDGLRRVSGKSLVVA